MILQQLRKLQTKEEIDRGDHDPSSKEQWWIEGFNRGPRQSHKLVKARLARYWSVIRDHNDMGSSVAIGFRRWAML